jgi:hypothetical protein
MRQASTVKIISPESAEVDAIIAALEKDFNVIATSNKVFDQNTKKYHQFVSVSGRGA